MTDRREMAEAVAREILPDEIQCLLGEEPSLETIEAAIMAHRIVYQHALWACDEVRFFPDSGHFPSLTGMLGDLAQPDVPRKGTILLCRGGTSDEDLALSDHLYGLDVGELGPEWEILSEWQWPKLIRDQKETVARRVR